MQNDARPPSSEIRALMRLVSRVDSNTLLSQTQHLCPPRLVSFDRRIGGHMLPMPRGRRITLLVHNGAFAQQRDLSPQELPMLSRARRELAVRRTLPKSEAALTTTIPPHGQSRKRRTVLAIS